MISVKKKVVIDDKIEKIIPISEKQIAVKIKNPIAKYRLSIDLQQKETNIYTQYPISISGFSDEDIYDYDSVIFMPLAEQYYHNFFEIFSRVLMLKNKGEKFKVIIVSNHEIENNVFLSLLRNHPRAKLNSAHIKDFFEYCEIETVCITYENLSSVRCRSAYLLFNLFDFSNQNGQNTLDYNNKKYAISTFFNWLHEEIFLENVEVLRNSLPKHNVISNSKIFISRSKAQDRKYAQEKELENIVIDLGYKVVHLEDIDFLDQLELVQSSSHIICPYGSALVNATLCQDSKILSINYTPDYHVGTYEAAFKKYKIDYKAIELTPEDSISNIKDIIIAWE